MIEDEKINLLLIDDDIDFRKSLEDRLTKRNYNVTAVESAEEALISLESESFEVIVSNIKLKAKQSKIIAVILATFLIITPLSIYLIEFDNNNNDKILIDGNFHDWDNVLKYEDRKTDANDNPNINIIEFSLTNDNNRICGFLKVENKIFAGHTVLDSLNVFVSNGIGITMMPLRYRASAEIVKIHVSY